MNARTSARLTAAAAGHRREARWSTVSLEADVAIEADGALAAAARDARAETARRIHPLPVSPSGDLAERFSNAFLDVRRERFVLPDDLEASAVDAPLPLDPRGEATVSAPHAYLFTFALLELEPGDRVLELGTGTGYGAALARRIVGPSGHVTSIEVDPDLHTRARRLLASQGREDAPVSLLRGDGVTTALRLLRAPSSFAEPHPNKIAFTYALARDPIELVDALAPGDRLVAPIGRAELQELVSFVGTPGGATRSAHGSVRYVPERRAD